MKKIVRFSRLGVVSFIITLFAGCYSNYPSEMVFSPKTLSGSDKALVYFYRPPGETFGWDRTYFISVNQSRVGDILHGGYFPYETSLGKLTLLSDVNFSIRKWVPCIMIPLCIVIIIETATSPEPAKLDVEVDAGKTYYVKMHPETNLNSFTPHLSLVTKEVGEKEIADCKLITAK
jgi:hypothetical protein